SNPALSAENAFARVRFLFPSRAPPLRGESSNPALSAENAFGVAQPRQIFGKGTFPLPQRLT
ncbi:MAG TPA: hypothetical protein PLV64_00005, partial [Anaerolineales bacterium]|nr:hypothetical protein [Anaerolineales bacterium]